MIAHEDNELALPEVFWGLQQLDEAEYVYLVNAVKQGRPLPDGRRGWLRKVLGVTSEETVDITKQPFVALTTRQIPYIVENADAIGRAADARLAPGQQMRLGLFLAGRNNTAIGRTFDMHSSAVSEERNDFIARLNGEAGHDLPETPRQHVAESRLQAKIEEDNKKLALALSWLFDEQRIRDYNTR